MLKQLEEDYKENLAKSQKITDKIVKHLHMKYDSELNKYSDFDDFLCDINNYAGDTFGKLLYINHAKNTMCGGNEA